MAGFTDTAYRGCIASSVKDFRAWPTTGLDRTFNSFWALDSGKPQVDLKFAPTQIGWRSALGARGVIADHDFDAQTAPQLTDICAAIEEVGAPLYCKTVSPVRIDVQGAKDTPSLNVLVQHGLQVREG